MRIIRLLFSFVLIIVVSIALLFVAGSLYGWDHIWKARFGDADMGAISFNGLKKGPKPNQALICPPGLCDTASLDFESPLYALKPTELHNELISALVKEAELERVDDASYPTMFRFVQRSKYLRFPDTINIIILPIGDDQSTIALYSRSQIGKSDFGVNLQRANRWLSRMKKFEKQT